MIKKRYGAVAIMARERIEVVMSRVEWEQLLSMSLSRRHLICWCAGPNIGLMEATDTNQEIAVQCDVDTVAK